jgi:hypothetical protein
MGEIGHFTIESTVGYLRLPEITKRIEGQIEVIGVDVEAIRGELRGLRELLSRFFNLET